MRRQCEGVVRLGEKSQELRGSCEARQLHYQHCCPINIVAMRHGASVPALHQSSLPAGLRQ